MWRIAASHQVDRLLLGAPRPALRVLDCGQAPPGMELVYYGSREHDTLVVIYRLTTPGVVPSLPADDAPERRWP